MARIHLHELQIIQFKKMQDEVFRWTQTVAAGEDFHIIGVRDIIDKSSLFEAFEFTFGKESMVDGGNISLTFHRIDNEAIVNEVRFSHIRIAGDSNYFIGPNVDGNDELIDKDEYFRQLLLLGINAQTQQLLYEKGYNDVFACPGIDLQQMLEVNLLPETGNDLPSISNLADTIKYQQTHLHLIREFVGGATKFRNAYNEALQILEEGDQNMANERDLLLLQKFKVEKYLETQSDPPNHDSPNVLECFDIDDGDPFECLGFNTVNTIQFVIKLKDMALKATDDKIKSLEDLQQTLEEDTEGNAENIDRDAVQFYNDTFESHNELIDQQATLDHLCSKQEYLELSIFWESLDTDEHHKRYANIGKEIDDILTAELNTVLDEHPPEKISDTNTTQSDYSKFTKMFRINEQLAWITESKTAHVTTDTIAYSKYLRGLMKRQEMPLTVVISVERDEFNEHSNDLFDFDVIDKPAFHQSIVHETNIANDIAETLRDSLRAEIQIHQFEDRHTIAPKSDLAELDALKATIELQQNRSNEINGLIHENGVPNRRDKPELESFIGTTGDYEQALKGVKMDLKAFMKKRVFLNDNIIDADIPAMSNKLEQLYADLKTDCVRSSAVYAELCQAKNRIEIEHDRLMKRDVSERIGLHTSIDETINTNAILDQVSNENRIGIDANEAYANILAPTNDHITRLRTYTQEYNRIAKRLSQHIYYDWCGELCRLKVRQLNLVNQHQVYRQTHKDRKDNLMAKYNDLSECLQAQVARLPFSPHLIVDETDASAHYLLDRIHKSTSYHKLAAIVLRISLLLVNKCPLIVTDCFDNTLSRPMHDALTKYLMHLVKEQHIQVISMIHRAPKEMDELSSVHMMWEPLQAEYVSDISKLVLIDDIDSDVVMDSDNEQNVPDEPSTDDDEDSG